VGGDWPLIGRDAELDRVLAPIAEGRSGVVLAGPTGVGKTRLAREFIRAAGAWGFATVRVGATQASSVIPFGAFAPLLPDLRPGTDRAETFRQVARAVVDQGGGDPVILVVDDAHLLDDSSASLTYQLAAAGKAFVMAAIRTGEPVPEPVVALWKDGLAERVVLEPLSDAAIDELLVVALGGPVDGRTRIQLAAKSGGNVMLLRELVLGAVEAGVLADRGEVWRLRGPLPSSDRVVELVRARLGGLAEEERAALELLAIGEPLGLAAFASLADESILSGLEERRFVRVEEDGRRMGVGLGHPLYGEVLRKVLPTLRVRQLSRRLAETVASTGGRRRDDVLRLGIWSLDGGGPVDPARLLAAARRASVLHDTVLADRLARAAADAGGGFDAELLVGQLTSQNGDPEAAERHLASLAAPAGDDARAGQLAIARVINLWINLGRVADGRAVAEAAERDIVDPAIRDELIAHQVALLDSAGRTTAALALVEPLLERASGRALEWACAMGAACYARVGRISRAVELTEQGQRILLDSDLPMSWDPGVHVTNRAFALTFAGHLAEAEALARQQYEQAVSDGATGTQLLIGGVLCRIELARGRAAAAARWGREAADLAREGKYLMLTKFVAAPLAEALALAGRVADAEAVLAELDALPLAFAHMFDADTARARGWAAAAAGDLAAAQARFEDAATSAAESGDTVWELAANHDLVRLGHRDRAGRVAELAAGVEGPLAPARATHADGVQRQDPVTLEAAALSFEALGALLLAAEAAADAATIWRATGESRKAAAAEQRARRLAARCDGARSPALAIDVAVRAVLTHRELEIARLAGAGESNRDISRRLHLSPKTVENRLHGVYEKLGIEGRKELADALSAAGLPRSPD